MGCGKGFGKVLKNVGRVLGDIGSVGTTWALREMGVNPDYTNTLGAFFPGGDVAQSMQGTSRLFQEPGNIYDFAENFIAAPTGGDVPRYLRQGGSKLPQWMRNMAVPVGAMVGAGFMGAPGAAAGAGAGAQVAGAEPKEAWQTAGLAGLFAGAGQGIGGAWDYGLSELGSQYSTASPAVYGATGAAGGTGGAAGGSMTASEAENAALLDYYGEASTAASATPFSGFTVNQELAMPSTATTQTPSPQSQGSFPWGRLAMNALAQYMNAEEQAKALKEARKRALVYPRSEAMNAAAAMGRSNIAQQYESSLKQLMDEMAARGMRGGAVAGRIGELQAEKRRNMAQYANELTRIANTPVANLGVMPTPTKKGAALGTVNDALQMLTALEMMKGYKGVFGD